MNIFFIFEILMLIIFLGMVVYLLPITFGKRLPKKKDIIIVTAVATWTAFWWLFSVTYRLFST